MKIKELIRRVRVVPNIGIGAMGLLVAAGFATTVALGPRPEPLSPELPHDYGTYLIGQGKINGNPAAYYFRNIPGYEPGCRLEIDRSANNENNISIDDYSCSGQFTNWNDYYYITTGQKYSSRDLTPEAIQTIESYLKRGREDRLPERKPVPIKVEPTKEDNSKTLLEDLYKRRGK